MPDPDVFNEGTVSQLPTSPTPRTLRPDFAALRNAPEDRLIDIAESYSRNLINAQDEWFDYWEANAGTLRLKGGGDPSDPLAADSVVKLVPSQNTSDGGFISEFSLSDGGGGGEQTTRWVEVPDPIGSQLLNTLRDYERFQTELDARFEQAGGRAALEYMTGQVAGSAAKGIPLSKQLDAQWDAFVDRVTDLGKLATTQQNLAVQGQTSNIALGAARQKNQIAPGIGTMFLGGEGALGLQARDLFDQQQAQDFGIGQFIGGGGVGGGFSQPLSPGVAPEAYRFTDRIPPRELVDLMAEAQKGAFASQGILGTNPPLPFGGIAGFQAGTEQIEGVDPEVQAWIGVGSINLDNLLTVARQRGFPG